MNPAGVTCNSKVFLSQITGKAMQSLGGPFPVALLFLSSPFFEQSCVPIMLPWNKENCEVIGMKRFGIWPCFKLTNPHPVFHCRYNNTGKRHSEHTPAMSPQAQAATEDRSAQQAEEHRISLQAPTNTHGSSENKRSSSPKSWLCSQLCSLLPSRHTHSQLAVDMCQHPPKDLQSSL